MTEADREEHTITFSDAMLLVGQKRRVRDHQDCIDRTEDGWKTDRRRTEDR